MRERGGRAPGEVVSVGKRLGEKDGLRIEGDCFYDGSSAQKGKIFGGGKTGGEGRERHQRGNGRGEVVSQAQDLTS